jgi:hypothetical protein
LYRGRPEFNERDRARVRALGTCATQEEFERQAGGIALATWHISRQHGIRALDEQGVPREPLSFRGHEHDRIEFQKPLTEALLAPGTRFHESPDACLALWVIRRSDEELTARVARLPVRAYDDFLYEIVEGVPIEFMDLELRANFLRNITWAHRLHVPASSPPSS